MFVDSTCPLCRRGQGMPCAGCIAEMPSAPVLAAPAGLAGCRSLVAYHGRGRDLVASLKFAGQRCVIPWIVQGLAERIAPGEVDVVTWAPTSRAHRHRRGFDQAEVLARRLARLLGVEAAPCLIRLPGPTQTGRDRAERLSGPHFDSRRGIVRSAASKRVLLVDDVVTTGATLAAAAAVLRANGAGPILGAVVARTPDQSSLGQSSLGQSSLGQSSLGQRTLGRRTSPGGTVTVIPTRH